METEKPREMLIFAWKVETIQFVIASALKEIINI